ncbi:MAG TPA: tripartite tricarboxylate transporter substrate-binding protein [Candidatus Binatia bacterium]|jgi:tripartite-type tricarboxylate transporter receptor subunit TctC|nr:tripartite tricarboxylate transporter substrate-binding protein [Candidatus Binatia bacterium]
MIRQIRWKMSKSCNLNFHLSSLVLFLLILYLFNSLTVTSVFAQTPFYQGKTITLIAGTKAGDVYDLYARLIAQYMPKYIPGNPNIIVQNVAGAGSMIAANQVYAVAKPDGLTLGAIFPALYFDQLIGRKEVQFDWSKFTWLGSPDKSNHLLYMRADTPYKTIDDVRNAKEPPKCGATGTSSTGYYMPKLFEELIGTKFNIVLGYQSGGDVDLAVEKGELQCRSFTIAAFFAREPFFTWRKTGFVRVLFQTGRKKDERLPDVPTIYELMDKYKTPEAARRVATVVLSAGDFGRPYVGPAGIPPDRVKILRDAFTKVVTDPAVVEEAKKRKLDIEPATGEELQTLAKEVITQPPAVIERVKKVLGDEK